MERSIRSSTILIAFLLSAVGPSAQATTWRSFWRNREGIAKFNEKSYFPAHQAFLKALEDDPLAIEIHLNIARTFEANEEWEKAEQGYRGVLKIIPENSPRRFEALFNLGGVLAKQNKIDQALEAYQSALDLDPDSKEVKTNIELLWQGGGGGGGQNQQDQNKDQQGKDQKQQQQPKDGDQDQKRNQSPQNKNNQNKPFESKELSQDDVKKILDEIKNQEQSIRAQEYQRNVKEAPRGKDW